MGLGAPIAGGGHNSVGGQIGHSGIGAGQASQNIQSGLTGSEGNQTTPIADKFMGRAGGKLDNSLDQSDSSRTSTTGSTGHTHSHPHGSGEAVSGQYEGDGISNALTGQSHSQRTGAGVGPMGENLGSGGQHGHSQSGAVAAAGVGAGIGAAGGLVDRRHEDYGRESDITRGPGAQRTVAGDGAVAGQAGEPLGTGNGLGGRLPGQGENFSSSNTGYSPGNQGGRSGAGLAGAGLAGAGIGAGVASGRDRDHDGRDDALQGRDRDHDGRDDATQGDSGGISGRRTGGDHDQHGGGRQGHYGAVSDDSNRGAPLSKDLDTGGPHSLVFQESTGRYVHRRDL